MNSARQVLRWGIPGWLLIIFILMFLTIRSTWDGSIPLLYAEVTKLQRILVATGLAIPCGFLIFQLYWRIHWWDFPSNIVHRDKGYEVLKDADIDFKFLVGISLDTTSTKANRRKIIFPFFVLYYLEDKPPDIVQRYQRNWYLADFAWYDTIRRHKLEFLEQRATFLGDVYHSLGAARTSLLIATSGYFMYDLIMIIGKLLHFIDGYWQEYLRLYRVPLALNLLVMAPFLFLFMLSNAREDTLEDLIALKHHVITSLHELPKMQPGGQKVGSGIPGEGRFE
jgi:hypothetical protein